MGRVTLVHDHALGREVVMKELLPPKARKPGDSTTRKANLSALRFIREAQITSQLDHPSIAPVYEVGERTDGTLYYTMKRVRGRTLSEAIDQAHLLRERLELLPHYVDLCQAVAYAHEQGVIHRDLKPSNVMVGAFGETIVLDWGLAKTESETDIEPGIAESFGREYALPGVDPGAATATGELLGSPLYMAPEQAKGLSDKIDHRTDIYALGAVLYQILTGRTPFEWTTFDEVIQRVLTDDPISIAEVCPDAPRELTAICERAMAKDRDARYPSAKELAEEVARFQNGALVDAYEYSWSDRLFRVLQHYRVLIAIAAVALAAVVVVSAVYAVNTIRANRVLERTNLALVGARNDAQTALVKSQAQRDLALEAIDKLTYDVPDRLKNYPRTRPVIREILEENVALLDRIAALNPDTEKARIEQVANLQRIGERWKLLGDSPRSLKAYSEAVERAKALYANAPDDHEAQTRLAEAFYLYGDALRHHSSDQEAELAYQESIRVLGRHSGNIQNDTDRLELLAKNRGGLAQVSKAQGDPKRAREEYSASLELWRTVVERSPRNRALQLALGRELNAFADSPVDILDHSTATEYAKEAIEIFEAVLESDPADMEALLNLSTAHNTLGWIYRATGEYGAALSQMAASRDLLERLLARDPDNTRYRMHLMWSWNGLGSIHFSNKDYSRAADALNRSCDVAEAILEIDPGNVAARRTIAYSTTDLARIHRDQEDYEKALEVFHVTQEMWESQYREAPADSSMRREVAQNFSNIGIIHNRLGQTKEAIDALQQSFDLFAETVEHLGYIPENDREALRNTFLSLGLTYTRDGQEEKRLELHLAYIDLFEKHVRTKPDDLDTKTTLAKEHSNVARVFEKLGQPGAAQKHYQRALELLENLAATDPDNERYPRDIERVQRRLDNH